VVEKEQKGRGYEVSKGEYVPIEKEELEAVQLESNHTIDIDNFVPRDEIDRRYLDSPYYLVPDGKGSVEAFAVVRDAMKDQDRVALARVVLSNRERVVANEPLGKGLLVTTLRYADEVRDEEDFFADIKVPKISKDMVELAAHILDTKAAHFDASKFEDEYENALKALVKQKASGKTIKSVERPAKADNVISLMDALKQSLKGKAPAQRPARASRASPRSAGKKAGRSTARQRKAG
jgi:Ku protein